MTPYLTVCLLLFATVTGVNSEQTPHGLFMSNGTHILFSAKSNTLSSFVSLFSQEGGRIVGLAVDISQGIIFWSDVSVSKKGIWRGDFDGEDALLNPHRIVDSDIFEVNGLTVDWISHHIYWTDGRKSTVEVAKYDGAGRHILSIDGLQSPRGIVVDPIESYLYWNDQGTRKIERSRLDGSDRKKIVTLDAAHRQPNQMAIHNSKLYWVDAYSQELWQCELDGSHDQKVATLKAKTDNNPVFGLAITSSGQSMVSVWRQANIISVNVDGSDLSETSLTLLGSDAVFSLDYADASLQPAGTSDCQRSSCSHICLPKDKTTSRCACPSFGGLALDIDENNCRKPANGVLLYVLADEGVVGFIDPNGAHTTDRSLIGRSLRPVAVAYDPVHKVVYWSDVYEHTVHQANFDGSNHKIFLRSSTHSIGVVDGLSVDAKHGRLYFSNMGTTHVNGTAYTWHRIETIKFDGTGLRTVITRAEKPRALWVDTDQNHLYYTSWGSQASVVRTNLDGTEPRVLLQNMDNPNGLAVGPSGKLYVVDSHDKTNRGDTNYPRAKKTGALYKSDKDGKDFGEVAGPSLKLPFGLAVSSDKIYMSDWEKNAIISVTISGQTETTVMSDVNTPMALFFTPVSKTFGDDTCSTSDCGDICLVTPTNGTTCTCNSYKPKILQTNLKACNVPTNFLLFADMGSVKMIGLDGTPDKDVYTILQGNGYFSNFVAIAYNPTTRTVYYSGVDRGRIYSVPLDGSAQPSVFYNPGHVIDGLALDSTNSRLYWTDYTTGAIAYKELTGNNNSTILLAGNTARKPRAVVVHAGYVYWAEWGDKARVARKSISSGSDETILSAANADGLDRINGLAIMNNNLYIGDASGHVFESNLNGTSAKRLRYITASHIYSLFAEENFLWYTDWKAHSLSRVNLDTGRVEILAAGLMRPSQVIVHYNRALTTCPSNNCEDTCSAVPGGYECSCPEGKMLTQDKAGCENVVSTYVEVDPSQCNNQLGGLSRNEVCGRKVGSKDVKGVCKAGYGGSNCEACAENHFKLGVGDEACKSCPERSSASGTGNKACKCSGNDMWNWKQNKCSGSPGSCPVISMHDDSICGSSKCSEESNCQVVGQKCCPVVGCGASDNKRCVNPVGLTVCVYDGTIYQVGTTFSPNPCTKCRCDFEKTFGDHRYGNAVCSVTDCPVLKCASGNSVKVSGQCCPVCKAPEKCPDSVTSRLKLKDNSNCVLFKPDWATDTKESKFCWKTSNGHSQTAKFKYPGFIDCEVKVIVVDEIPPKITCPEDQVQYTSKDELTIQFAQPSVLDKVGLSSVQRTDGGEAFPVGKTTEVVFTATDKAGNKATCNFKVTVKKQDAAVEACEVPRPTHGLFKCNDKLSCDLVCEAHYVRGPGSDHSHYECSASTWAPQIKDSFTNLACVLRKKPVVTSSVSLQLAVEADQVVFLKASLEDYIREKFILRSRYPSRIKQLIIIKGQDRKIRRARRATRDMDVTMELYIELQETDAEKQKKEAEEAKKELDRLAGDLRGRLEQDIKQNKVKLDADGNNGVQVKSVTSTQAEVGCLPGEQQIGTYCVVCPVGTFFERASKKCVLCAENMYQELEGQTQCRNCPAQTHSDSGSYVQAQCITDEVVPPSEPSFPLMIVIGAAVGVVVLIIIVIVIVVVCKRRSSSGNQEPAPRGEAHTNEAYYMQPVKGIEESHYEDIPADHAPDPPKKESDYAGLGSSQKEPNVYDRMQHK